MASLAYRSAAELMAVLSRGELSSVELLDHLLNRIERRNPEINAVVALATDAARDRARDADAARARGESWGALHGLPMTIKDSIEVVGMATTSGAPELARHHPARDADAAARLIGAGAIVFGKTNLPFYAGDVQSYNEVYGTTNNPWDVERVPGGSSGGAAAALAAGFAPLELGSDIGGSIRNPAHFCGVYGHKPSYGVVPGRGHIPGPPGALSDDDLGALGPLARTPADLALALDVLAGPTAREAVAWRLELPPPRRQRLSEFRIAAWFEQPSHPVAGEVVERLEEAAARIEAGGARVDRRARPGFDPDAGHACYLRLLYSVIGAGFSPALRRTFARGRRARAALHGTPVLGRACVVGLPARDGSSGRAHSRRTAGRDAGDCAVPRGPDRSGVRLSPRGRGRRIRAAPGLRRLTRLAGLLPHQLEGASGGRLHSKTPMAVFTRSRPR